MLCHRLPGAAMLQWKMWPQKKWQMTRYSIICFSQELERMLHSSYLKFMLISSFYWHSHCFVFDHINLHMLFVFTSSERTLVEPLTIADFDQGTVSYSPAAKAADDQPTGLQPSSLIGYSLVVIVNFNKAIHFERPFFGVGWMHQFSSHWRHWHLRMLEFGFF